MTIVRAAWFTTLTGLQDLFVRIIFCTLLSLIFITFVYYRINKENKWLIKVLQIYFFYCFIFRSKMKQRRCNNKWIAEALKDATFNLGFQNSTKTHRSFLQTNHQRGFKHYWTIRFWFLDFSSKFVRFISLTDFHYLVNNQYS